MKCIRHIREITLAGWYEKNILQSSEIYYITFHNRYHIVIHQFPEISSCTKYMIKILLHGLFEMSGPRADQGSDMKKAMWSSLYIIWYSAQIFTCFFYFLLPQFVEKNYSFWKMKKKIWSCSFQWDNFDYNLKKNLKKFVWKFVLALGKKPSH